MNITCAYDDSSKLVAGVNQIKYKSFVYIGFEHYIKNFGRGHQLLPYQIAPSSFKMGKNYQNITIYL